MVLHGASVCWGGGELGVDVSLSDVRRTDTRVRKFSLGLASTIRVHKLSRNHSGAQFTPTPTHCNAHTRPTPNSRTPNTPSTPGMLFSFAGRVVTTPRSLQIRRTSPLAAVLCLKS